MLRASDAGKNKEVTEMRKIVCYLAEATITVTLTKDAVIVEIEPP